MNNTEFLKKRGYDALLRRYTANSSDRWKAVGFVQVPHSLVFDKKIPPTAAKIYCCLLARQFKGKTECNPSMKVIEEDSGYSKYVIIRAISILEKAKWVEVIRKHRKSNTYRVKRK